MTPCAFGQGASDYDGEGAVPYSLMFHSFDYPDETGEGWLRANFWWPNLVDGVLTFPKPDEISRHMKKDVRRMQGKHFGKSQVKPVEAELLLSGQSPERDA